MRTNAEKMSIRWLRAGTLLDDRYRITGVLGEGGFGITYAACHNDIDRPAAIKEFFCRDFMNRDARVMKDVQLTDEKERELYDHYLEKFLSEARILSEISGVDGVVRVTDYFRENNTAYIVMDLIEGTSLEMFLRNNKGFAWDDLAKKMMPLIKALSLIHKKGMIHRDIKPDNIIISEDGEFTLIDFGAAIHYEGVKTHSVYLTEGYAAKEQYLRSGNLGPHTDVYSLCAVMYHCITGRMPEHSIQRAVFDELKTPSEIGIPISPAFEKILMKGLQVEPEDRWQDMDELYWAVSSLLPKEKRVRRSRYMIPGLLAVVLSAAAVYIALNYNTLRISLMEKRGEVTVFSVHATPEMTAENYEEAVDILRERADIFSGKNNYLLERDKSTVTIHMPNSVFENIGTWSKNEVLNTLFSFSGKWLMHNLDMTEFQDLTHENIAGITLQYGKLPVETLSGEPFFSSPPIYWSKEDDDYYLEIEFDEETADFLKEFLEEAGYEFVIVVHFGLNEYGTGMAIYPHWIAKGDGKSAYLPLHASGNKNLADAMLYLLTQEPYESSLELMVKNEETQRGEILFEGENADREYEEILELVYDIHSADTFNADTAFIKKQLELLKIPYKLETGKTEFSVLVPAERMSGLIVSSLGGNYIKIRDHWDGDVDALDNFDIQAVDVKHSEDGVDLTLRYSEFRENDTEGDWISDGLLLYVGGVRIGSLKTVDAENTSLTFHLFFPETETNGATDLEMAEFIRNIILERIDTPPRLAENQYFYHKDGTRLFGSENPALPAGINTERFSALFQEIRGMGGTAEYVIEYSKEEIQITFENWSGAFPEDALGMMESLCEEYDFWDNICSGIEIDLQTWYKGSSARIQNCYYTEGTSRSVKSTVTIDCEDAEVAEKAERYIESSPILNKDVKISIMTKRGE